MGIKLPLQTMHLLLQLLDQLKQIGHLPLVEPQSDLLDVILGLQLVNDHEGLLQGPVVKKWG